MRHFSFLSFVAVFLISITPALAADTTILQRLAVANAEHGKSEFKKCLNCHTIERKGEHSIGPNLWGILHREVAKAENFEYSKSFKELTGKWSVERLDSYLEKPRAHARDTNMTFVGIKKPSQRANLIAYLNQNSDLMFNFAALSQDVGEDAEEPIDADEYGVLFVAKGVEETHAYCTACHSERIVAQQGLDRAGWEELLEWMEEEQGMSSIDEPDLELVLSYLSTHYNKSRPNFPK